MKLRRWTSSLLVASLIVAVALLWILFAPRPLGGPVSYVVTDGISMQPRLSEGDLVIVRETDDYGIGDVVAYQSSSLGRVVLHRIIDVDADRYVFQGDNNDFIDLDEPTVGAFLGKEWIVVPGAGKALGWVGEPLNAALLAAAITLLILGGSLGFRRGSGNRHRDRPNKSSASSRYRTHAAGSISTASIIAGAILVLCLVGGAYLFGQRTSVEEPYGVSYRSEGRFDYSADAKPSAVYPSGKLRTGEPIFLNLVDELAVRFEYRFQTKAQHSVSGQVGLSAEVSDSTGWRRTMPVAETVGFEGDTARTAGVLDLRSLRRLVTRIQRLTGIQQGTYTLSLRPSIDLEGRVAGEPIEETFTPALDLQFDHLKLTVVQPPAVEPGARPSDPLAPVQEGSIEAFEGRPNTVGLGPVDVSVETARWLAGLGAILAALAGGLALRYDVTVDGPAAIQRRYGSLIVDVASLSAATERKAIEMKTIHDLAALAERYDRAILHDEQDGIHSYIVEEEGIAYWYQAFVRPVSVARSDNVAVIGHPRPQQVSAANATLIPGEKSP